MYIYICMYYTNTGHHVGCSKLCPDFGVHPLSPASKTPRHAEHSSASPKRRCRRMTLRGSWLESTGF